jgi:hypothetical protein
MLKPLKPLRKRFGDAFRVRQWYRRNWSRQRGPVPVIRVDITDALIGASKSDG